VDERPPDRQHAVRNVLMVTRSRGGDRGEAAPAHHCRDARHSSAAWCGRTSIV